MTMHSDLDTLESNRSVRFRDFWHYFLLKRNSRKNASCKLLVEINIMTSSFKADISTQNVTDCSFCVGEILSQNSQCKQRY